MKREDKNRILDRLRSEIRSRKAKQSVGDPSMVWDEDPEGLGVKRGSWAFDMGYGNLAYDHDLLPDQRQILGTSPEMIHLWSEDDPKGVEKTRKYLYESIGDLLDRMQDMMDYKCGTKGQDERGWEQSKKSWNNDPEIDKIYAKSFRHLTGSSR